MSERSRALEARSWLTALLVVLSLTIVRQAGAQRTGNVAVFAPPEEPLRSVTPTFVVQSTGFSSARPLRITLQLSTSPTFTGGVVLDTTFSGDSVATVAPSFPLGPGAQVYYRASVVDPQGVTGASSIAGPKTVPAYVTPISPPVVVGQPVRTRTPRFVWRSPDINEPPGPWRYVVTITNVGTGASIVSTLLSDTTFVPGADLESNTTYRWSVEARVSRGPQAAVAGPLPFVVEASDVPISITGMYPSFPNPFPTPARSATCIWFDLKQASTVKLDVYDLRGLHVKRILPNGDLSGVLPAARYGRGRTALNEGCDSRTTWDGTDDRGRHVPEGVYQILFAADGVRTSRKVLFRGRH